MRLGVFFFLTAWLADYRLSSVKMHDKGDFLVVRLPIADGGSKHPLPHNRQRFRIQVLSLCALDHRLVHLAILADDSANGYINVPPAAPFLRLWHRLPDCALKGLAPRTNIRIRWRRQDVLRHVSQLH